MEGQRTIDFTRAEQLAILREAILPPARAKDGRAVRPSTAKAILRTIDDHGARPFLTYATIAEESNCKPHTVRRAVEVLQELGVLCVERRATPFGGSCNHYRLVWSELSLLRADRPRRTSGHVPPSGHLPGCGQVPTGANQVPTGANQVPTGANQVPTGGQISVLSGSKRNEAPPPLSPPLNSERSADPWEEVVDLLTAVGIRAAGKAVAAFRSHGNRATRAHQLIAEWQSLRDQHADARAVELELGALYWTFENATPMQLELDSLRCFPSAFVSAAASRAAAADRRRQESERLVEEKRAQALEQERARNREAAYGPLVDAAELQEKLTWLEEAGNDFLAQRLVRDPTSPVVRAALIDLLATAKLSGGTAVPNS